MRLTVLTRRGCHLCEDMLIDLALLAQRQPLDIETVDIDSDAKLAAQYGDAIPVLMRGTTELCRGRLNRDALDKIAKN